jgi:DNA-directed RNA polymerase subunit K/omega
MLNEKILTIQEHESKAGSRFVLAGIIMKRVNQLIKGYPVKKGLSPEFDPGHEEIVQSRFAKIALEEFRTDKLKWNHPSKPTSKDLIDPNDILFNG